MHIKHNLINATECVLVAMIDSIGGPQRVDNILTTLHLPLISHKKSKSHGKTCWANDRRLRRKKYGECNKSII